MDCNATREALSALLDGEEPGLAPTVVHRHLAVCAACQAWEQEVARLNRATRAAGSEPAPDLSQAILTALAPPSSRTSVASRVGLAGIALVQLLLALPALHSGMHGASVHLGREIGVWDLALAAGFLAAAWRPSAAAPLIPLVGALVVGFVATGVIDIAHSRVSAAGESGHGIEIVGLALLWLTAHGPPRQARTRTGPRPVAA